MARKHNTKHHRSPSGYPARLQRSGRSRRNQGMPTLEELRKKHGRGEIGVTETEAGAA